MRRAALLIALAACRGGGQRAAPASDEAAAAVATPIDGSIADLAPGGLRLPLAPVVERFDDAAIGTLPGLVDDRDVVWGGHGGVAAWVTVDAAGQERVVVNGAVSSLAFDHVDHLELARDGVTPIYAGNRGGTIDPGARVRFVRGGTEQLVVGDAVVGEVYDHVLPLHDADEPDAPFAYLASRDQRQRLMVDGRAPGPWVDDLQIEHLTWKPDGTPAFRARDQGKSRVVIGEALGPLDDDNSAPRVAARTGAVVYVARHADGAQLVIDRSQGPVYDKIGELAISPDGVAAYEGKRGDQIYAVVGGKELGPYDRAMRFGFGAGGKVAFMARRGPRWFVVVDGEEGPPSGAITEPPVWSPDGAHVAWAAGDDHLGPQAVIRDGRPVGVARGGVDFLRRSADGRHLAWTERVGRAMHIVVDGTPGADFDRLGDAAFDGAGAVIYEGGRAGRACLVRGTVETCHDDLGEPNLIAADESHNFTMDPDRTHVAYRARSGAQWSVIVDGVAGPPADAIWPPIVSADGTRVGYGYRIGRALGWRAVPFR